MAAFHFELVSPEKLLFSGEVDSVVAPGAEGQFTVLKDHAPVMTTLKSGVGDPVKVNVIPSSAEATLDCRLLPGVNVEEFMSDMRARINDPRVTVELLTTIDDTPGGNELPGSCCPTNGRRSPSCSTVGRTFLKVAMSLCCPAFTGTWIE